MVVLSLRRTAAAVLQERRRKRRSRGRAMHDSIKRVAPEILLEKEEEDLENKRLRRTMQDSNTWVTRHVPLDLLIEILTRLPAKSVIRFKCISKFWSSLLCSTYFCNRFFIVPSRHQPRLYMSLLDRRKYSKSRLLSSSTPSTWPSTLEFDQDLTIRKMGGFLMRVCRGFICLTVYLKARIYNPTTRKLFILPAIVESDIRAEKEPYDIFYFLGHDPVNDQYKILCTITIMSDDMQMIRSERWLFVLEAGGSWKRVAKEFPHHFPNPFELNMNGILYYLAWTDMHTCVLVSFDLSSEEFNVIQVPRKAGDLLPRLHKLVNQIDYGGKVAVFDYTYLKESGTVDLWVVQDWRKKEWLRKTLVLQPSQLNLVIDSHRLIPKGTTLKGKVILVPRKLVSPFYFLCYDLQINDLKKVEIKGILNHWFSKLDANKYCDIEFMNPSENIKYLET